MATAEKKTERPEIVKDEHLTYPDKLRESGETNMYDAGAYLIRKFRISHEDATNILLYWMYSFSERHPA